MKDERRLTPDLYALIGIAVADFIREDRAFKANDVTLALHEMKSEAGDEEFRHLCDAAIRLLADLMH
ncbi:hypothetical protein [Candidatus Pantoea soli]|uniref:hypothetical protein n=1 Tax=Candidatus Pantoea soli TaxID=3098669 RepID=UPI0011A4C6AF|nr:hypothetical protein [Pantoea soli]